MSSDELDMDQDKTFKRLLKITRNVQRVFIDILECPDNCKIMESLVQVSSHLFSLSSIISKERIGGLLNILDGDITICT